MTKTTADAFEGLITAFVQATKISSEAARECANVALQHFHDHNDGCYLDRFLAVLEEKGSPIQDYIRKEAFIKWLVDHAPVTRKAGRFVKDKSENAMRWRLKKALETPFWLYAKADPTAKTFGVDDFLRALTSVVERYEDGSRFRADTDATKSVVTAGHSMVTNFRVEAQKIAARKLLADELKEPLSAPAPADTQSEAGQAA